MSSNAESRRDVESAYVRAGVKLDDLTSAPEYRGLVEVLRDGVISGWCVSTVDPTRSVTLELWLGDTKLHAFATSGVRPDIEKSIGLPVRPAFSTQVYAFEKSLAQIRQLMATGPEAGQAVNDWLSVRVSGQPVSLEFADDHKVSLEQLTAWLTAPVVATPNLNPREGASPYRGYVDAMIDGAIRGWCVNIVRPDGSVQLEVYYGNLCMGVVTTSEVRNDINSLLRRPAISGFKFRPEDLAALQAADILSALARAPADGKIGIGQFSVRIAETNIFLPFAEDFSASHSDLARFSDAANRLLTDVARNHRLDILRSVVNAPMPFTKPQDANDRTRDPEDIGIVAFYLPQFHPFPENDEWWGNGFTEWTNVTAARPTFRAHNQPRVPADLGYYDLRLDAVHERQTELARKYKISAFCYYFYSFSGKTLMTMPIDRHFEKNYDLDFCLCWANENWSRRWDGSENDVLIRQNHSEADDNAFIDEVLKYFVSPRYIKIDGAPLLLVYRIDLLANPAATITAWKRKVRAAGFPDLHVSVCETFGINSPVPFAADSSCQFPPHTAVAKDISDKVVDLDKDFSGRIYDYVDAAAHEVWRPDAPFLQFRTAMPSWDNTSRKGRAGHVFHNASPATFEAWLSVLCAKAMRNPPGRRLVFVNAWNEWAEGAYLEPDRRDGHRNLKAVRAARSAANLLLGDALSDALAGDGASADLVRLVSSLASANRRLVDFVNDHGASAGASPSPFVAIARGVFRQEGAEAGLCNIERINGRALDNPEITLDRSKTLSLTGWLRTPGVVLTAGLPTFLKLGGAPEHDYVASLHDRFPRGDVAAAHDDENGQYYGFNGVFDLRDVPPGVYRLQALIGSIHQPNSAHLTPTRVTVIVG